MAAQHRDGRDDPGDDGYRSSWTDGPRPHARQDAYGQRLDTDADYRRWRDEQMQTMDRDYDSWRRERFARDFAQWRAIRAAQSGLRTGSGPPITHGDRERELRGPEWPERWDDGHGDGGSHR